MFELLEKCSPPLSLLACVGALAIGAAGCKVALEADSSTPRVELIDRTTRALTSGTLRWANGTYGSGCSGHTNGEAWSLRISGSATMAYPALSVAKNDSDCALTLTALDTGSTYEASPPVAMTSSYNASASSFATRVAGVLQPVSFYGNVKLSATTMATNFTVTIAYSDNARSVSSGVTATYGQYSGAAVESPVAAPNYTVSFGNLVVLTDDDDLVETLSGTVDLTAGSQVGQSYVVVAGLVATTYTAVASAYAGAGTPTAIAATIPVSAFSLSGAQLPVDRSIIIANTSNGISAYQVVRITFNNPSSCTQASVTKTATSAVNSGSGNSWTFPGTISTQDDNGATMGTCCSGEESKTLLASGFGFSLPADAQVRGVEMMVRTKGGGVIVVSDKLVELAPYGVPSGTNLAYATYPGSVYLTKTYGGSTSLWGLFLSPAVVNDATFAVAYRLQKPAFTVPSAYLDLVSVTIYYCS